MISEFLVVMYYESYSARFMPAVYGTVNGSMLQGKEDAALAAKRVQKFNAGKWTARKHLLARLHLIVDFQRLPCCAVRVLLNKLS